MCDSSGVLWNEIRKRTISLGILVRRRHRRRVSFRALSPFQKAAATETLVTREFFFFFSKNVHLRYWKHCSTSIFSTDNEFLGYIHSIPIHRQFLCDIDDCEKTVCLQRKTCLKKKKKKNFFYIKFSTVSSVYDHTTVKTRHPVRSAKLSTVGLG